MKIYKIMATSALALVMAGTSFTSSSASTLNPTEIKETTFSPEAKETTLTHQEYFGDDTWKNVRKQIANFQKMPFRGEAGSTFSVHTNNYDLRYNFANTGDNSFTWKIFDPRGNLWSSGTLSPGQSKTYTALNDLDSIPLGLYRFSVITTNGGLGEYSFTARILD